MSKRKKEVWSFAIVKLENIGLGIEDKPGWAAEVFIKNPDGTYDETQYLDPGDDWDALTESTWEPCAEHLLENPQAMYEDLLKRGGIHDPSIWDACDREVYLELFSPKDVPNKPKKITTEDCKEAIVSMLRESNLDELWVNIDDPSVHETRESWVQACLQCLHDCSLLGLRTEEEVRELVLNPENWIRQRKYNHPYDGVVREFSLRGYDDIEARVEEKDGQLFCQIERD